MTDQEFDALAAEREAEIRGHIEAELRAAMPRPTEADRREMYVAWLLRFSARQSVMLEEVSKRLQWLADKMEGTYVAR